MIHTKVSDLDSLFDLSLRTGCRDTTSDTVPQPHGATPLRRRRLHTSIRCRREQDEPVADSTLSRPDNKTTTATANTRGAPHRGADLVRR